MPVMKSFVVFAALVVHAIVASGQTWCGKHYMEGSSVVLPGGEFPVPATSEEPLLAFRCAPAIKPYLADDDSGIFIIDTLVTNSKIAGAVQLDSRNIDFGDLLVTVSVNGHAVASGSVPMNASAHELDFSLKGLAPQAAAFEVECTARLGGQTFHANSMLRKLPNPTGGGSVTKMDMRTGAMLVQGEKAGEWDTLFPIGFYTIFDGYLSTNLSVVDDLKDRGFTIIHIVPTFDNMTAFNEVLDRMEEVGIYLMYDMRYTYMNLTSVTEQVNMIKDRKNLLLWYTGDEPDGTSDPLNATKITYDLINELDGGYHPVSLVLNCQDYYFTEYIEGTDVVMEDVYPVSVNATFSAEWHTPCTPDFGDCGCDNCKGNFDDIAARLDEFTFRLNALGESRTKTKWGVPQAFGGSEYWPRAPTGNEWLVQSIISISHGATGIVPWSDPTPQDIKDSATDLAKALPTIKTFLFDPTAIFSSITQKGIDIGLWTVGQSSLVLATNTNNSTVSLPLDLPGLFEFKATNILNSGGSLQLVGFGNSAKLSLDALGSVGFVIE